MLGSLSAFQAATLLKFPVGLASDLAVWFQGWMSNLIDEVQLELILEYEGINSPTWNVMSIYW